MRRKKTAELLTVAIVLVGASVYAAARMGVSSVRTIPYQGVLEQNGAAANGDYLMRFGLFVAAPTVNELSCVVNDNCALWSEEQLVTVTNGRFSVLLGDSDGDLTDQVLANNTLHLGMAVKPAADASPFVALEGSQEIVPVPWAARPAAASTLVVSNSFRVLNGLTTQFDSPTLFTNTLMVGSPTPPNTAITGGAITSTSLTTDTVTAATVDAASGMFTSMRIGHNADAAAGTAFREVRMGTVGNCGAAPATGNSGQVNFAAPRPATVPWVFVAGQRGLGANGACQGAYADDITTDGFEWRLVIDQDQGPADCDCIQWVAFFP